MIRTRLLTLSSILLVAACAADSAPPDDSGPDQPATLNEQTALTLGMSIMSSDASGAPRLMRAIKPRASAPGLAPAEAARDHVTALASLWVQGAQSTALTTAGTQPLRNGAAIVKLSQTVDGVIVHDGELRVMLHADGSLAAVSGTLLPSTVKATFVSSPIQALERSLDQLYGKLRPQPPTPSST
jgi:hypothetical protein